MKRRTITIGLVAALLAALPLYASAQPFEIRAGQSLQVGELLVGFDAVAEDSRCPIGLLCFWEGNAVCEMWAEAPGVDRETFRLNTSAMFPREATVGDYRILLVKLDPYPVLDNPPDPENYVATIFVTGGKTSTPTELTTWGRIKALYSD